MLCCNNSLQVVEDQPVAVEVITMTTAAAAAAATIITTMLLMTMIIITAPSTGDLAITLGVDPSETITHLITTSALDIPQDTTTAMVGSTAAAHGTTARHLRIRQAAAAAAAPHPAPLTLLTIQFQTPP